MNVRVASVLRLHVRSLSTKFNVNIDRTDDLYFVKLDQKTLKTPMRNVLGVPNKTLALAIANEWQMNVGTKKKLELGKMPLTTLAYTAIDNPFNESNQVVIDSILEYLKFDTIKFRDTENEELMNKQSRHWDPMIGWFEHRFKCHLPIEYGHITDTVSIPKKTSEIITRHLQSYDRWPLVGIQFMAQNLKSFVLATSLTDRFLQVDKAVELARLETRHQVEKWSKVEWEHDMDEQCTNARVAAGALFYHLSLPSEDSTTTKAPNNGNNNHNTSNTTSASIKRPKFKSQKVMTIPNVLTFSRLAVTPVVGYLIWNEMFTPALYCFAFAAFTDLLDGVLARALKQYSDLGAMLDPIADKLLLTTCFIAMYNTYLIPMWVIKIFILKDVALLAAGGTLRYFGFGERPTLRQYFDFNNYPTYGFEPSLLSKFNTALQCSLIVTHLATHHLTGDPVYDWSMWSFQLTTAFTTLAALATYSHRFSGPAFFAQPKIPRNKT